MLCHHKCNIKIKLNFTRRTIELDIAHLSVGRSNRSKATEDSSKMESIYSSWGKWFISSFNNNKGHVVHHDTAKDSDVILTTQGTDIHCYFKFDV